MSPAGSEGNELDARVWYAWLPAGEGPSRATHRDDGFSVREEAAQQASSINPIRNELFCKAIFMPFFGSRRRGNSCLRGLRTPGRGA